MTTLIFKFLLATAVSLIFYIKYSECRTFLSNSREKKYFFNTAQRLLLLGLALELLFFPNICSFFKYPYAEYSIFSFPQIGDGLQAISYFSFPLSSGALAITSRFSLPVIKPIKTQESESFPSEEQYTFQTQISEKNEDVEETPKVITLDKEITDTTQTCDEQIVKGKDCSVESMKNIHI